MPADHFSLDLAGSGRSGPQPPDTFVFDSVNSWCLNGGMGNGLPSGSPGLLLDLIRRRSPITRAELVSIDRPRPLHDLLASRPADRRRLRRVKSARRSRPVVDRLRPWDSIPAREWCSLPISGQLTRGWRCVTSVLTRSPRRAATSTSPTVPNRSCRGCWRRSKNSRPKPGAAPATCGVSESASPAPSTSQRVER